MEVGKLAHSHSQPGGMDRTPPGTPKKGGKMLAVRVQMLDDTVTMFQVQGKALGRVLFDQVCNQLNLLESDYFGLEYQESGGTKYWLDLEKPLCRQVGLSLVDTLVRFCVKFYPPDPSQLEEEFTRYLFCLQIKRDLSQGLLQCNSNTAALMASYIVQAECGDYVVEDYPDHRYLSTYKFVPNQDQELERRIMENHKKHAGQTPAEADLNLLETARRCELYGIKMHPAKDHEGCPLNLAVAHMGIVVFQNFSKINTFSWAKIRKISFKRKRFLVKLHPEGYGYYKDTVEFFFEGRNECKNFWKKCVENHGFFRCTMVKKVPRQKTRVLSRGSSFRYSGRTQKQIVDYVRENYVKRQTFQRSQSFRHSSSAHSSVANVGTSISAHPLLPLGDNAVVGTPVSLSCGSMTLNSSPVHIADIHAGGSPSPQLTTSVSQGTSVTSSPQHFYPQETPYRRAGHQLTKVKRPQVHSRHAISPLHSPTDVAKGAGNHSASHSNNVTVIDSSDILSSRSSLKSPEFMTYNDVYSNCYTSLRDSGNSDNKIINETKSNAFDKPCDFSNSGSVSHESIKSFSKNCDVEIRGGEDIEEGYKRHRSASCRDIYHGEKIVAERKSERILKRAAGTSYEFGENYDKSRRKCYSAFTSKNPSLEHPGDVVNDMRIYSSSYPGTTSSLSTESAEGELIEVLDMKYDSQEDVVLSHDDVSHDSYELLERELDYNSEKMNKRSRIVAESERARSCSWGSDRGDLISPLDFRSTENVLGSESPIEHNFWSLERGKNSKHKSEIDFRSFANDQKANKKTEEKTYEENLKISEFSGYANRFLKRSREKNLDEFDNLVFNSKGFEEKELCRNLGQEIGIHLPIREDKENSKPLEKKSFQSQRKSLEKLDSEAMFKMKVDDRKKPEKKREKREKDERFHEGFKKKDPKRQVLGEDEENCRKIMPNPNDYTNFQEIHFKKFDRVVSNQFGKYPEFLARDNDYIAQEKVLENYEKVCQVSKMAKELKKSERTSTVLFEKSQENIRNFEMTNLRQEPEIEQFQSLKKKSMGVTNSKLGKAHVERTKSDPYNSNKNQKRSILIHQKSIDLTPQQSEETVSDYDEDGYKKTSRSEHDIPYILHKRHFMNGTARSTDHELKTTFKSLKPLQKEAQVAIKKTVEDPGLIKNFEEPSLKCSKLAEAKKAGVQIINLDLKSCKNVNILEPKIIGKVGKASTAKKLLIYESKMVKKEIKKVERSPEHLPIKSKKEKFFEEKEEPIYAEVCKEKVFEEKIPPEPPARTSSVSQKSEETGGIEKRSPTERTLSLLKLLEVEEVKKKPGKSVENREAARGKQELPVVQRREESLTLFARTRLGLSEGSAFAPIVRQSNISSPVTQRRTKSLDAPYVSVHSLPPADAFSSKDDTVDGNESDVVNAAVARFKDIGRKFLRDKSDKKDLPENTESEVDSVFTDDVGTESTFKKIIENQSKVEVLPEEKVLDPVRGKRLLSKIESVDFIDSEGDMDSSKLAEPVPIPSDRLVNLPESIRFPSVRQISGQTSEESADGWEQKEVKVKRRTPRRSVGREEQDTKESVVWDSKDEAPDDDVWDDSLPVKCDGSVGLSNEYLKRGSCGQSIDDDNLSTPIKESSPEHWVSVDDLPEALEREEKLLRQQEKILREKILNEKIKRELNLDTIDVDERYCENLKQKYEEESMSLKENFKGHSLDTYELTEKKLREKGNKNSSLDEDLLLNKRSNEIRMFQPSNYRNMDYIQCKVVKDVAEIDQFGDNDEELEEFFVVLDENLGKEDRNDIWDDENTFRRTISNDESLISVPEEFKDEKEEPCFKEVIGHSISPTMVEIRLSRDQKSLADGEDSQNKNRKETTVTDSTSLSPYSGSRRGSEENRKLSSTEESGRLSPYDNYSRRSSGDTKKHLYEITGRVSPFDDSRRGSDDPRRLSTSEDSRKCSVSESVSEETRRRLSSTEETRRKRASLTKQCSVGAESISDEIISGIQGCNSSFEQDEKDVFEESNASPHTFVDSNQAEIPFEMEVSEEVGGENETKPEETEQMNRDLHLAPPASERELSRETEDSVDYCEVDLKDIREVVKEKDISEGKLLNNNSVETTLTSSFEKSKFKEWDKLRFNDDNRESTSEVILDKSKDGVTTSTGDINEEIPALNKLTDAAKTQSLSETVVENVSFDKLIHTLPKKVSKPIPPSSKPVDYSHKKLMKVVSAVDSTVSELSRNALRSSLDSSQESDLDKLSDFSLITHVQNQIVRRNLSDTGRCLRRDEFEEKQIDDGLNLGQRTSSDEREKTESSSIEMKSSADENADEGKWKGTKGEKLGFTSGFDKSKTRSKRSPDQDKRDSGEDGSSSSSTPLHPKRELSSTWKPFLLESSGSSSLEEGWLPPDENAHLADEEETSSTSNNQQDDSYHDDVDYSTSVGYPVLNMSSAEMMVGGYGSVYALSRTLSRISERSTSEQDRSEEDDITKPTSHSVSAEEESILSSDHQPSLSSDPPSPKEGSAIPDLPIDRPVPEPFRDVIPPPVTEDDWPSPPSSSSVMDTPVVSHIETFYMEIQPEEACKVVVAEPQNETNSSSDENQTLHEESEIVHLSSDVSVSTTTTTQDGTVVFPVRPKSSRAGSFSEDASISVSEWSSPVTKSRSSLESEWQSPSKSVDICHNESNRSVSSKYSIEDLQKPKILPKVKPLKVISPTRKTFGFFETPVSKVRSPTSQIKFFETREKSVAAGQGHPSLRSPTSFSETPSPKNYGKFFDGQSKTKSPTKGNLVCTPYYSNVADFAEKSYFGRYDTGSLERTKVHSSRKYCSYYSVSKTVPNEGDSSNSDGPPVTSPNTIPRASKKIKKRHRVAMDLIIRDGKIVAPPKTNASIVENSDSDRSSPWEFHTKAYKEKDSDFGK